LRKYQTHFLSNTLSSVNSFFLEFFFNFNCLFKTYFFNKHYANVSFSFFFKNTYFSDLFYVILLSLVLFYYQMFYKQKRNFC
jgi:hypothetical protein